MLLGDGIQHLVTHLINFITKHWQLHILWYTANEMIVAYAILLPHTQGLSPCLLAY